MPIAKVHKEVADNLQKGSIAPDVLMLVARAFARAELDLGRPLQEAMMSAMEAQAPSMPAALSPEDFSDHFAELAATLDNDPFAIYAELATMAAAFPAEHHAGWPVLSPCRKSKPCARPPWASLSRPTPP